MKTLALCFTYQGTPYRVSLAPDTLGHVMLYGSHAFPLPHPSWRIVGFSRHPCARSYTPITVDTTAAKVEGALIWDQDHGTPRQWRGQCYGKIARARSVHISPVEA